MIDTIIFDLDGTLTDPKEGITRSVQHALKYFGIEESNLDKLEPFIGPPLLDSFQEFYGFEEEKGQQAIIYYRERFSTVGLFENEVYPGVPQMLARLQENGCRLAVASSKPEIFVKRILEHFGLLSYFEVVVGSELDGRRARKEEVVEEALRQLLGEEALTQHGLRRIEDAVMVGDRKFDVQGAKRFGIAFIGVRYGYAGQGELEEAGADMIVATVGELDEYLFNKRRSN